MQYESFKLILRHVIGLREELFAVAGDYMKFRCLNFKVKDVARFVLFDTSFCSWRRRRRMLEIMTTVL